MLATENAQERMVSGDLSPRSYRISMADREGRMRVSKTFTKTWVEDHDAAKTALAICHRDEDNGVGEDAHTEEAAMIKAAAGYKHQI